MHEKLGHAHLARMHFSWAMDLDPKGANNQLKEAIEPAISRGPTDDDRTGQLPPAGQTQTREGQRLASDHVV